ncbi:MAG: hypothetical protein Q9195_008512 [Heterodermia aff. obscurata]
MLQRLPTPLFPSVSRCLPPSSLNLTRGSLHVSHPAKDGVDLKDSATLSRKKSAAGNSYAKSTIQNGAVPVGMVFDDGSWHIVFITTTNAAVMPRFFRINPIIRSQEAVDREAVVLGADDAGEE